MITNMEIKLLKMNEYLKGDIPVTGFRYFAYITIALIATFALHKLTFPLLLLIIFVPLIVCALQLFIDYHVDYKYRFINDNLDKYAGKKVKKISGESFKSNNYTNTINGIIINKDGSASFLFEEDDCIVNASECEITK